MKQEAIRKINTMGKAGVIISRILQILMIIGAVGILIAAIFFTVLPKDFLTMNIEGSGTINVNIPQIMGQMTEEQMAQARQQMELENASENASVNGSFTVYNSEMDIVNTEITSDGVSVEVQGNIMHFSSQTLRVAMWMLLVYMIMTIITIIFVKKLCKAFQTCETPFEENVILRMRNVAYCLIPFAVLSTLADSVGNALITGSASVSITINVSMILVILVLLALTYIFKYGAVLQQESDETL